MPVIHMHYVHDLTIQQKKDLTAELTRAVHETTGVPTAHVQVWLHKTESTNQSVGGVLVEQMLKGEAL